MACTRPRGTPPAPLPPVLRRSATRAAGRPGRAPAPARAPPRSAPRSPPGAVPQSPLPAWPATAVPPDAVVQVRRDNFIGQRPKSPAAAWSPSTRLATVEPVRPAVTAIPVATFAATVTAVTIRAGRPSPVVAARPIVPIRSRSVLLAPGNHHGSPDRLRIHPHAADRTGSRPHGGATVTGTGAVTTLTGATTEATLTGTTTGVPITTETTLTRRTGPEATLTGGATVTGSRTEAALTGGATVTGPDGSHPHGRRHRPRGPER